ncbi:MAG: phosphoribosylanthranilate isomerase [Cyanobacteria bacterium KgW148]|nr:phosphoribosylanthranilate isomerase [Cyanobacteria bacterium KgW148]
MTTIKICGITSREQAETIASLGVNYLGFIVVPRTPRYVQPDRLPELTQNLTQAKKVVVFRNPRLEEIKDIIANTCLDGIQLHGKETIGFCQQLKEIYPRHLLIKAIGVQQKQDLELAQTYSKVVDVILLDGAGGGTGTPIDWQMLGEFQPSCRWWLAGGINPHNAKEALMQTKADGLDLSSGVEDSPGKKNIAKIKSLLSVIR